jgi:hypothetical protein
MSEYSFGKMSVANAERGASEGRPSRDRAIYSLFDRVSATQPPRVTVGRCGGSITKAVVIKGSDSARASKRAHDEASSNDHMGSLSPSSPSGVPCLRDTLTGREGNPNYLAFTCSDEREDAAENQQKLLLYSIIRASSYGENSTLRVRDT